MLKSKSYMVARSKGTTETGMCQETRNFTAGEFSDESAHPIFEGNGDFGGPVFFLGVLIGSCPLLAAPITVHFAEGSIHGFFVLRTQEGRFLAQGDLFGAVQREEIQKTTVFRFKDGFLFEETVAFSQKGVYVLRSYRLKQLAPLSLKTSISHWSEPPENTVLKPRLIRGGR